MNKFRYVPILMAFLPAFVFSQFQHSPTDSVREEYSPPPELRYIPKFFNTKIHSQRRINALRKTNSSTHIFLMEDDGIVYPAKKGIFDLGGFSIKATRQQSAKYNIVMDSLSNRWIADVGKKTSGWNELPFWFPYGRREFKSVFVGSGFVRFEKSIDEKDLLDRYQIRFDVVLQHIAQISVMPRFNGDSYFRVLDSETALISFVGTIEGSGLTAIQITLSKNGNFTIYYVSYDNPYSIYGFIGFSVGAHPITTTEAAKLRIDFRNEKLRNNVEFGVFEVFYGQEVSSWLDLKLYEQQPDSFDAIVHWNHSTLPRFGGALGSHGAVRRAAKGIGKYDEYNYTDSPPFRLFSSIGLTGQILDPLRRGPEIGISTLNHEFGHQWLFNAKIKIDEKTMNLDGGGGHPISSLDTRVAYSTNSTYPYEISCMGTGAGTGAYYFENLDGSFTRKQPGLAEGYSLLDLYLMGIIPADSLKNCFFLENVRADTIDPSKLHADKIVFKESNLTAALGQRYPVWPNTQKNFKAAIIYIYPNGLQLTSTQVATLDSIGICWENLFSRSTGGLASLSTELFDTAPNIAPLFVTLPDTAVQAGLAKKQKLQISDPDGDSVMIYVLDSPRWISVLGDELIFAPPPQEHGDFTFIIRLADRKTGITDRLFTVHVNNLNSLVCILKEPINGAIQQEYDVKLKWISSLLANQNRIQVSRDSLFSTFLSDTTVTDSVLSIHSLRPSTKFWWRVKPVSDTISIDWSEIWYFTTKNPPPSLTESDWNEYYINDAGWINSIAFDSKGSIYAGSSLGGLFRSTDGCKSWDTLGFRSNTINQIAIQFDSIIYVGTSNNGLYISTSGGGSWNRYYNNSSIKSLYIGSESGCYVGTEKLLLRTTDQGFSWQNLNFPTGSVDAIWSLRDTIVVASGNYNGLYRTTDYGSSWTNPEIQGRFSILVQDSSGRLYSFTPFRRSEDNGKTWIRPSSSFDVIITGFVIVKDFAYFSATYSDVFTKSGITRLRLTDGEFGNRGNISDAMTIRQTSALVLGPNGKLYSGSCGILYESKVSTRYPVLVRLIFPTNLENLLSTTVNLTWSRTQNDYYYHPQISTDPLFNSGMVLTNIRQVDTSISVSNLPADKVLYWRVGVSSLNRGPNYNEEIIYTPTQSFNTPKVTEVIADGNIPTVFALKNNYPNPFNPSTNIEYQVPINVFVSLKVYDILGREIAKLVNEVKPIGVYRVVWDAGILSSGIYFYRMQAGSFVQTMKLVLLR